MFFVFVWVQIVSKYQLLITAGTNEIIHDIFRIEKDLKSEKEKQKSEASSSSPTADNSVLAANERSKPAQLKLSVTDLFKSEQRKVHWRFMFFSDLRQNKTNAGDELGRNPLFYEYFKLLKPKNFLVNHDETVKDAKEVDESQFAFKFN